MTFPYFLCHAPLSVHRSFNFKACLPSPTMSTVILSASVSTFHVSSFYCLPLVSHSHCFPLLLASNVRTFASTNNGEFAQKLQGKRQHNERSISLSLVFTPSVAAITVKLRMVCRLTHALLQRDPLETVILIQLILDLL